MDLLPHDALLAVSQVLTYGAKYGERNWELGMEWGRMHAALLRHLSAWSLGEDDDPESGLPHLAHMSCCALMLLSYTIRKIGNDTRNKPVA